MNPFKSGFYAVELVSHKVFRYAVPFFLFSLLISAFALAFYSNFFTIVFALQIVFYLMALIAWILERAGKSFGLLAIPLYFVLTNVASLIGFYKFLRGERSARWETIRETADNIKQAT
jgi:hypothetical protein